MTTSKQVVLEGAKIGFKNFEGHEDNYNSRGERNFVVYLTDSEAERLTAEGWNVKYPKDRDDIDEAEDARSPYLQVKVNFNGIPPKVVMVNPDDGNETLLDETNVGILDGTDIDFCDIIITPYHWTFNGKNGVKAYLRTMYVNIVPQPFSSKYRI